MDRRDRDKFVSSTGPDLTSGRACWETAPKIFEQLNHDFGPFDLDLTADAQRHLCPRWFGPGSPLGEDAIAAAWIVHGRNGYSNPPYGPFVPRLLRAACIAADYGFTSTLLLPLRVTKAFQTYVLDGAAELRFCSRRLVFYEQGEPRWNAKRLAEGWLVADCALFDSMIVRFVPGHVGPPAVGIWTVPDHAPKPRRVVETPVHMCEYAPGCISAAKTGERFCVPHLTGGGTACARCQGTGRVRRDPERTGTGTVDVCEVCAGVGLVDKSLPRVARDKVTPDAGGLFVG